MPTSGRSRLVIAPNWIGDSVMAFPLLRAMRRAYPGDSLTVLARPGPAPLFRAEGSADGVWIRSGFLSDITVLTRSRIDEAWLLPNSFRAALLAFLGRIPDRVGYATDGRGFLLTHAVPLPGRSSHQLRDYDALLLSAGVLPDTNPPRLPIPPDADQKAQQVLLASGLNVGPLVLLAPGSAFSWTKRWPPQRYGRLASSLLAGGIACGIVVGPGEQELGRRVSDCAGIPVPILGEDLDPVELAALLARANLLVANDSGPMHIAAAVGTPVVAFFGPTDPGRTAPSGAPSRILDRYVFCSPCFLKTCPYRHECMEEISVAQAFDAVEDLLGQTRRGLG